MVEGSSRFALRRRSAPQRVSLGLWEGDTGFEPLAAGVATSLVFSRRVLAPCFSSMADIRWRILAD
jgi:hypothetical protein